MTEKLKKIEKFYDEIQKLSYLEFEELIFNTENIEKKLFFNMLLEYAMEKNFKKTLENERY